MIGASKILTVSYGTFSCTLEGFDEPFSTMKAIAEYFRDLAADDRYFGAEPPTPDAEMLHRIAEKEIQRRVEAKISEYGVVLRQTDAPAAPPMAEPAPAPVAAPESVTLAPVALAPVALAPVALAPVSEPVAEAPAPAPEPIAEAAVAEPQPEPVAASEPVAAPEPVAEAAVADLPGEPAVEAVAEPVAEDPVPASLDVAPPTDDMVMAEDTVTSVAASEPDLSAEEADAFSIDDILAQVAAAPEPRVDDVAAAPLVLSRDDEALAIPEEQPANATAAAEDDSIAAKLMRIRAVVENARNGAPVQSEPAYEEDEAAADTAQMPEDFGFSLDLSEDMPELEAAETARAEARAADDLEDLAAIGAEDDVPAPTAMADEDEDEDAMIAGADAPADEPADELAASEDADLLARLSALGADTTAEEPAPAPAAVATPERSRTSAYDDWADDETDEEADASETAPEDAVQPSFYQRARARVIRLSKAVTQPAEEPEEDAPAPEPQPHAAEEMAEDIAYSGEAEAEHDDDPDVSRLMAEAQQKLEGAETRRRFSAISHLKAAVAATLADRKLQSETDTAEPAPESPEITLYRDDLSKAVRPRRPVADAGATTQRPSMELRPAPLVLVSEQRVDRPEGDDAASAIRPRRVVAGAAAYVADDDEEDLEDLTDLSPEDVSSFAEFAERLGAVSLTEMLEAAAAYTASVEGRQSFSRPHLLRKVEFVSSRGEFSREDGMRSFGMLLRQGKIQKVSRGQFTITDTSKFITEARKAM